LGYATAEDVLNRARALINDARIAGGEVLTDNVPASFQYLNSAYLRVQHELAAAGIETFEKEAILTNVPAVAQQDASVQVSITFAGTNNDMTQSPSPALPADLLVPVRMWERQNGSGESFIPMVQPKDGLKSVLQTNRLLVWEWRADGIYTPGALQANDLRLRYEAELTELSGTGDTIGILGGKSAVAYALAEEFATAHGAPGPAAAFQQLYSDALERMKLRASRRQQHTPHRRRPYSWRRRVGGGLYY
jgi:hypothetical protein